MAGDAREKNASDHVGYADWSAKTVHEELHKAGWRLADLLTQALTSTSTGTAAAAAPIPPEPMPAQPSSTTPTAALAVTAAPASSTSAASQSQFGAYPENYKEIVTAWIKASRLDPSRVDWQGDPKPTELPIAGGRRVAGYLVIFNMSDRTGAKTRSVLIRDGAVVNNSGF